MSTHTRSSRSSPTLHDIEFTLNGDDVSLSVPAHRTLVGMLREDLHNTGTTEGCGVGVCGSCTVLIDGEMVSSCLELAVNVDRCTVETVEGLANSYPGDGLHPLQEAFQDWEGYQCGYCTPGMLMGATALLRENSNPSPADIKRQLSENICRCTGYKGIIRSVEEAAKKYNP